MKTLITLVALVAAFAVFAPRNAWAVTPDSLNGFAEAPQVKKFHDAWAKCGLSGDACPDKKSVADATHLRKEAIQDCLKSFVDNAPEKVGPCKVAVGATPETFSMKVVEPVRPVRPTKPLEPRSEPRLEPEDAQPEPNEAPPAPNVKSFVTRDELEEEVRDAVRVEAKGLVAHPQPTAPSNDAPRWLMYISGWNILLGILNSITILFLLKKRRNAERDESAEPPSAENAKVRDLREKSVVFQCQIELEEQIEPEGARVETLKTLKERNDITLDELLDNLDKKPPQ